MHVQCFNTLALRFCFMYAHKCTDLSQKFLLVHYSVITLSFKFHKDLKNITLTIQKLQKWCCFWIQTLLENCNFWIHEIEIVCFLDPD